MCPENEVLHAAVEDDRNDSGDGNLTASLEVLSIYFACRCERISLHCAALRSQW